MERVIGIDLGTTNSCVAIVEAGVPTVIPNRGGYRTTPSMVAVAENGRRLVGHIAKRQAVTNAENTAAAIKRLIGRPFESPAVEGFARSVAYRIVCGPQGDARARLRDQVYSIPELSAFILTEMKSVADDYVGEPVSKAVITVPANFKDAQRQATKDAGRIAGLDVIRIIPEPTAAALAYGFGKRIDRKIAVFDLGGGTFDISILQIGDGVVEVIATDGDPLLGGEDFDRRVVDWLVEQFRHESGIDLRGDRMAMQRLKDVAETAKCELSAARETEVHLPFIMTRAGNEPLHLYARLSRERLGELCADLVDRAIDKCAETLAAADIQRSEVEDVILVGGQTRMPLVQERVGDFFGQEPCKGVHPDEVVALGAAIQGAALVDEHSDMLLLDVTPHALGIRVGGRKVAWLIDRNTTVPTRRSGLFTTTDDFQTQVRFLVVQGTGESDDPHDNDVLGEFMLDHLRPAPKGETSIEVNFEISADGILGVSATETETGQRQSITLVTGGGLTEEEIQRMRVGHQDYAREERSEGEFETYRRHAERLIEEIERIYPGVEKLIAGSEYGRDALRKSRAFVERARGAIESREAHTLLEASEALDRTLNMFKGVVAKARVAL